MARHLAIFSANGFTETFTRAHVEWLSPRDVLSGSPYPDRLHGDPILGAGLMDRLARLRLTRFGHIDPQQVPFEHYLRTHRPDVLFAEFGTSSADVVEGCARHGVELVGSFYGVDAFEQGLLKKYADRYKRLFGYAKAIMVQSRSIASQLERMGCPAERIVLNPCPPDPSFADLRCDAGSRTICAIGRFVDKKSPVSVALMMERLVRKAPDVHLLWAGDGPLLPAARELVNALGLSAQVTFVGRVHPEEQKRIMSRCAMLVQHSVTAENGDREGLPVVIMEAMLAGLPVVSTVHSGIPEVVEHGRSGWLVPEHDIAGMAEGVLRILNDRSLAVQMGRAGRAQIAAKHSRAQHVSVLKGLIDG